jgi:predicted thioesterase
MNPIPVGTRSEHRLLVTPDLSINFLGSEETRVLGTPWMIAYMEWTSRNAIKPFLAETEDSVGTTVNIQHLAATPLGMSVRISAEVLSVAERRVLFRVEAWDEKEKIGAGTHERFVVDIARFATRLAAKKNS